MSLSNTYHATQCRWNRTIFPSTFLARSQNSSEKKKKNNCGEAKSMWENNFFTRINEIIKGSSGGSRPQDKGGWGGLQKILSALRAPVWSNNKVGGGGEGRAPEPLPLICHWGENLLSLSPLFVPAFSLFSQKRLTPSQATNTHL